MSEELNAANNGANTGVDTAPAAGEQKNTAKTGAETQRDAAADGEQGDERVEQAFAKRLSVATKKAKDELISEMFGKSHGIHTYDDYLQAIREQQLRNQGIDPDILNTAIENHPAVREARQIALQQKKAELKEKPFFAELEPEIDKIMAANPNVDAQTAYSYLLGQKIAAGGLDVLTKDLRERIAKLEQGIQVKDKNAENAEKSTGSATGQGQMPAEFFTREQVEAMSLAEVNRHWKAIMESQKHWK